MSSIISLISQKGGVGKSGIARYWRWSSRAPAGP